MPRRIQMTRQRPWRAEHPEAVIVARPSNWGNPFEIGGEYVVADSASIGVLTIADRQEAAGAFWGWLQGEIRVSEFAERRDWIFLNVHELVGRDLACWCPLELSTDGYKQCHADVLLELANGDTQ